MDLAVIIIDLKTAEPPVKLSVGLCYFDKTKYIL